MKSINRIFRNKNINIAFDKTRNIEKNEELEILKSINRIFLEERNEITNTSNKRRYNSEIKEDIISNKKSKLDDRNNEIKIVDDRNDVWYVTDIIASGGCGRVYNIYSTTRLTDLNKYVIKFEPKYKGTLRTEIAIYRKLLETQDINDKKCCLNFITSGSINLPQLDAPINSSRPNVSYNYMIIEKAEKTLYQHICSNDGKLGFKEIVKVASNMHLALYKLHKKGYVHRDIKPDNIVFNKYNEATLIDYGLTRKNFNLPHNYKMSSSFVGTLPYAAIDIHYNNITYASDYESLVYNIFEWSGVELPWRCERDPLKVGTMKEQYRNTNFRTLINKLNWTLEQKEGLEKVIFLMLRQNIEYYTINYTLESMKTM